MVGLRNIKADHDRSLWDGESVCYYVVLRTGNTCRAHSGLAREIAYRLRKLVPLLTYMMPSWYHERRHCTASARSAFVWGLCSFTTLPAVLNNRSSAAVDAGAANKVNAKCLNTG